MRATENLYTTTFLRPFKVNAACYFPAPTDTSRLEMPFSETILHPGQSYSLEQMRRRDVRKQAL